jgi:hypothetical protein
MKKLLLILAALFTLSAAFAQDTEVDDIRMGKITYLSSQNIYVGFENTDGIQPGDTLYLAKNRQVVPALIVTNLSSISCVCRPIPGIDVQLEDIIQFKPNAAPQITPESPAFADTITETEEPVVEPEEIIEPEEPKEQISGRVSVSSYADLSDAETRDNFKMRYILSLSAANISDSKLSFESYIAFSHRSNEWSEIKNNIYNGLKIYNLSVNYTFSEDTRLWFGRRINPRVSSIGAIDGLQAEHKLNNFTLGAIAGSRPDWTDYSFNFKLFQAGVYASHEYANSNMNMMNTIAIVDQENNWNTDRRFIYLQHTNRLLKKLYIFGSGEIDLYKKVNGIQENTFNLTNLYLRLRYRVMRNLSFSLSYSARNNVILYETYKSFIERLLETETLQGFVASVNVKPVRNINVGLRAGYRDRGGDIRPSKNLYGYVNFARLPVWDLSATATAIFLETSYLRSKVFGLRLSRDLIPGKLFGSLGYRNINYDYLNQDYAIAQNCIEFNLNLKTIWKIYASLNYESTFDKDLSYYRVYVNLTKRF